MKLRRLWGILLIMAMILVPQAFTNCVFADDGSDSIEFEVTESVYNDQYKNDPNYQLIKELTYYRYRTRSKSYTESGYDTLSGWTYDSSSSSTSTTSSYSFGTPISTSTSYANNRKTVKSAVNTGWYYYAYTAANPNQTSDWAYYAATTRQKVIDYMKSKFNSSSYAESRLRYYWRIYSDDQGEKTANVGTNIPHVEDSTVSVGVTTNDGNAYYGIKLYRYKQCYKVKTVTTINKFWQWSAWSAWSDWSTTAQTASNTKDVQTEKRYLIRYNKPAVPLTECTVTLPGGSSFTYDGAEKRIAVEVKYGDTVLTSGTDYVVAGNAATAAGSYIGHITGIGDYVGELSFNYTVKKAQPIFDFDEPVVTKGSDAKDFINDLQVHTDGNLAFSSTNENVATVGPDGTVSIVGKGQTRIVVTSTEGDNYLAGESGYDLIVSNNLYDCVLSLTGPSSFTYNGEEKHLTFTVYDGEYKLVEGKDYTVENNSASDVGTYTVKIRGAGEYVGEKEEELTINKANPVLSFASAAVIKRTGSESFINELTVKTGTDAELTFSSSDTGVATVDDSGEVTVLSPGTVTISVVASACNNYKQGRASYSLTVADASQMAKLEDLSYSFINARSSFNYASDYVIPASSYRIIFGKFVGSVKYKEHAKKWGGNCAGFSGTSALIYDKNNDIHVNSFSSQAEGIKGLAVSDKTINPKTDNEMTVLQFIEAMQVAQFSSDFQSADSKYRVYNKDIKKSGKNLNTLFNAVAEQTDAGVPVLMTVRCSPYGHALLAYSTEVSGDTGKIHVYDSNDPLNKNSAHSIELTKDSKGNWTGWTYNMGSSYGRWGTGNSVNCAIGMVPYGVLKNIWENQGEVQTNYNMMTSNSKNLSVYDVDGTLLASVEDGELKSAESGIILHDCDLAIYDENPDEVTLSLPIDIYTIKNDDDSLKNFEVSMINAGLGSSVSTTADEVTMVAADDYGFNQIYIEATNNDSYNVTLSSMADDGSDELNEIVVEGMGSDGTMQVSQTADGVSVANCQVDAMSVGDMEFEKHQIRARAFAHGTITPEGTTDVIAGTDRVYKITPDPGYEIGEVIIDDESVDPKETYIFKNVSEDHEILVTFEVNTNAGEGKLANSISAENVKKTASASEQKFNLNAASVGIADLSYKSDNSKVKVDSKGNVTIAKNFAGTAIITITAAENDTFQKATKKVTVSVKPAAVKNLKAKAQKKRRANVTWKAAAGVTGYEIQYGTAKNFKGAKTLKVKGAKKAKATLKKLKAKKTYYIRIRAYVTDSSGTLRSAWSGAKKIKAKK